MVISEGVESGKKGANQQTPLQIFNQVDHGSVCTSTDSESVTWHLNMPLLECRRLNLRSYIHPDNKRDLPAF